MKYPLFYFKRCERERGWEMKHMFHLTCYFELMLFQPSSELNYSERHGRVTFRCKKLISFRRVTYNFSVKSYQLSLHLSVFPLDFPRRFIPSETIINTPRLLALGIVEHFGISINLSSFASHLLTLLQTQTGYIFLLYILA